MRASSSTSTSSSSDLQLPLIPSAAQQEPSKQRDEEPSTNWGICCGHTITCLLPILLLLQFQAVSIEVISSNMVYLVIAMFTLTCFLYQRSAQEDSLRVFFHLLPELTTTLSVACLFFQYQTAGFLCLVGGMFGMSCYVVISSLQKLLYEDDEEEELETDNKQVDILVV